MKNGIVTLILLGALAPAFAQIKTAQAYYDYVTGRQQRAENALLEFANSLESDSAALMYEKLANLDKECKSMMGAMNTLEPFRGHVAWRDALIALYQFYDGLTQKEYVQLIDYSLRLTTLTEMEFNELSKMMGKVTDEENRLIDAVNTAKEDFLKKYGPVKLPEKTAP